jgi:hypothetical protein
VAVRSIISRGISPVVIVVLVVVVVVVVAVLWSSRTMDEETDDSELEAAGFSLVVVLG